MTTQEVVAEARTWLGTRFHHQASLKGVGCDCIGLVAGVAAALGMADAQRWEDDVRRRSYTSSPSPSMLLSAAADYLVEVPVAELGVADIPLMRARHGRDLQHFGILTSIEPRTMIHAHAGFRRVVENGFEGEWANSCARAYRYRALA